MNIYGYTLDELKEYFVSIGENPAKAKLVFGGIYKGGIKDFREFGFAERITSRLESDFSFTLPEVVQKTEGADAAKLLLKLSGGEYVETVLMRQRFGNCVCVSTQIGCNMGCAFCQSGLMKKRRDLELFEITGQVLAISREFSCDIDGVSVMGIGEPFDNFDNVCRFCDLVSDDNGLSIGRRHITVSTCGIVPKIREFADRERSYSLAISLHAPNDTLRSEIMPINRGYPIAEIIKAAEYFSQKTHKRVTLEYILLGGFNDSREHAIQLAELIGERDLYVNLIPYNPTDCGFTKPEDGKLSEFCGILKEHGVIATKRREFGAELKAACGQLSSAFKDAMNLTNDENGGIIEERSNTAIAKITDSAVNKVPYVELSGYTDEQCSFIQQQHIELLKYSRDNNNCKETAFVFDGDLNSRKEFKGSDDKIAFGNILFGKDLFIMHNHPRNNSFSDTDIAFLLGTDTLKTLSIVKNSGSVEILTKTELFNKDELVLDFKRQYKKYVKTGSDSEIDKAIQKFIERNKEGLEWKVSR